MPILREQQMDPTTMRQEKEMIEDVVEEENGGGERGADEARAAKGMGEAKSHRGGREKALLAAQRDRLRLSTLHALSLQHTLFDRPALSSHIISSR
ncbi:hypothetical protein SLA2020_303680 [Shorea laevis]